MAQKDPADRELTAKQALFVVHYLRTLNASQAALDAGYSPGNAAKYAHELMIKPQVIAAIAEEMEKRIDRAKIDADYVLRQAVKLHERCMQEIEPFTDRQGNHIHDAEGRPLYVFNATGAAKALEMVGKHIAVQAFREKVDLSNPDGSLAPKVIDAANLSTEALKEIMGAIDATPETDGG